MNAGQSRYSNDYGNSSNYGQPHNYGSSNQSSYGNQDRNRSSQQQEDEGFFGDIGHQISNVWDRWVGNDDEEQRR